MATNEAEVLEVTELRPIVEIPVDVEQADQKIRTDLEGVTYVLRLYWNTREERWHLSIMDADEERLVMGIPLVVDTDVIGPFVGVIPGLMPGIIMLYDTNEKFQEATRDSMGDRHKLLYQESEPTA
jgi:hypothetical protein